MREIRVFIIAMIFSVGFIGPVFGQSQWTQQQTGTSESLGGISFADTANGWAVGANGLILHTSDSGTNWDTQTTSTTNGLGGVYSLDSQNCWAVGEQELILHTSDGGANWENQHQSGGFTSASLYDVCFVNADTGWAVGSNGKILYTSDGGANWSYQTSGTTHSLESIAFGDAQNLWIVGNNYQSSNAPGFILHTSDGGANWEMQPANGNVYFYGVSAVDANHAWIAVSDGSVLYTEDGGSTWSQQTTQTDNTLNDIDFIDANTGIAVGGYASEFTLNGGSTWSQGASNGQLKKVDFVDTHHIWAIRSIGKIYFSGGVSTDIQTNQPNSLPQSASLAQNYPNPFNPTTKIQYTLPIKSLVKITVFNDRGEVVRTLIQKRQSAGFHTTEFDGSDLSSGMYFYRITTGNFSKTRKMILLK